jgi:hypothetical protein
MMRGQKNIKNISPECFSEVNYVTLPEPTGQFCIKFVES